jgi:DNA adenine methylase
MGTNRNNRPIKQLLPHPIPYQGSKRNLAPRILAFFPENIQRIIEPFAGSAAVSLAALHNHEASSVILADDDPVLMQLWTEIINKPEDLANAYKHLWIDQAGRERKYYDYIRSEFNRSHRSDYFLYLLARCVKAAVRYNGNGEFNQSPDNRRKGANPQTVRKHLLGASQLLSNRCLLMCKDYRETLASATLDDIVYLDPPYQGVCQKRDPRYKSKVAFDDFVQTLQSLNERKISYIVSYDGRTGTKLHGKLLPPSLDLVHLEIQAGRSAQATLLGRQASTIESLYLSPSLVRRLKPSQLNAQPTYTPVQLDLFAALANP